MSCEIGMVTWYKRRPCSQQRGANQARITVAWWGYHLRGFRWESALSSASLETTLELWSTTLRQAKQRIRPLFAAPRVAASANAFLDGLLGGERRKTGWMRAGAAGDPGA